MKAPISLRLVLFAVVLVALLAGASSAVAAEPWFHMVSVSRPGNLHAGQAKNELQEVSVTPEEIEAGEAGSYFEVSANGRTFEFATGLFASAGITEFNFVNVQKALEEAYG